MSRQITKELAEKIATKLGAVLMPGKNHAHDLMGVYHNDSLITQFGIRRGSEKDKGHDHVQRDLRVSTRFAKELGTCTKSRDQWIKEMQDKGIIPNDEKPTA
jgi:hypothetical protein